MYTFPRSVSYEPMSDGSQVTAEGERRKGNAAPKAEEPLELVFEPPELELPK
jgi:hypothetical protein